MVQRLDDWITAKVGDELVMMSMSSGKYLGLNDVGACIWEMIEAPISVDTLETRLLTEFEVEPEICAAELAAFIQMLVEQKAVVIDGQQPA